VWSNIRDLPTGCLKLQYDPAEIKEIPEKKQIVLKVTVLEWDVQTDIVMDQIA
jgi:hypothetical protein